MNRIKKELVEFTDLQNTYFEKLVSQIKDDNLKLSNEFLTKSFKNINFFNQDSYDTFFIQFLPYFDCLTFSKNDNRIDFKLRELGFSNALLKYLINIDEIVNEIRRIQKNNDLIILPFNYFFACYNYLTIRFKIKSYEYFFGPTIYNGIYTNKLFIDTFKRNRRISKNSTTSTNYNFDKLTNDTHKNINDFVKITIGEEFNSTKKILKYYRGDFSDFINLFQFKMVNMSKNQAYEEHFELFRILFKDKKLLNQEDFLKENNIRLKESGDLYYENNYKKYKITKVRDIFKCK